MFRKKLKTLSKEQIWEEYCGFLDLDIKDYMYIQNRLMTEQLETWKESGLGKMLLNGMEIRTIEDFRKNFPLTRYGDYADVLLPKKAEMLSESPIAWIETTWESGIHPVKFAPYTRSMLDTYKHNVMAVAILAAARKRGEVNADDGDHVLYGGAPLPYATGLIPSLLNEEIDFKWLPDVNATANLSFGDRIKEGFRMAFTSGIEYFFAVGSIANYITDNFGASSGCSNAKMKVSIPIALRYITAKLRHKADGKPIMPGEVFRLKGFISSGTDAEHYRKHLQEAWGVEPIEIAAGTETTCLGTEIHGRRGMTFFPDACFYEFIPDSELQREEENPGYIPRTCLMDGVRQGESYELVVSVLHGGAFMRYRIGDIYRCVFSSDTGELPRFSFSDRVLDVIDIASFTRITEESIKEVLRLSHLPIGEWIARKEFNSEGTPFFHFYCELMPEAQLTEATSKKLLAEHLAIYFKYFDSDYSDLKKLLNMEPLQITMLKTGTIGTYEAHVGRRIRRINTDVIDMESLLNYRPEPLSPILRREGVN